MKNNFRAGDESEDAKSYYRYGFLKRRAVEHAGMLGSTYKQKILRVFFQKFATNLQLAVGTPSPCVVVVIWPDGAETTQVRVRPHGTHLIFDRLEDASMRRGDL